MTLTVDNLLMCAPDLDVQLLLLFSQGLLWFFGIPFIGLYLLKPMIDRKKWKPQFAELYRRYFKQAFFVEFPDEEAAYTFSCVFMAIMVQHAIGGILCVPAGLGLTTELAAALARHGALCEAGWELQDAMTRVFQIAFTKDGWVKNPPALVMVLAIHHTLGLSMIVPMNLYYPMLQQYHELVFLLQFAAFVAMVVQSYGFTLDVSKRSELVQMKLSCCFVMLVMAYSRAIRFFPLGYSMISYFRSIDNTTMVVGGCIGMSCMSILNVLFLTDCFGKFVKFVKLPLPTDDNSRKLVRQATSNLLAALSETRHPASYVLTPAQRAWCKVRGAEAVRASINRKSD